MKAFVLKNNKGLYYTTHLNNEEIHTEDISVANIFNREIADSVKLFLDKSTCRYGEKWKVIETTIAEGDLEQENKQLKEDIKLDNAFWKQECDSLQSSLSERDREIDKLKHQLTYYQAQVSQEDIERFNNNMLAQTRPYEELEGKSLYEISQIYQNQVRNKICDGIREKLRQYCDYDNEIGWYLTENKIDLLISKIEKGELYDK